MDTPERLHKQLSTLRELRSIVKTMKTLSAASIRQYEQAVDALAQYNQAVERGLYVLVKDTPQLGLLNQPKQALNTAAIIFGSDHGLCGRFNETIADYARCQLEVHNDQDASRILAVGTRLLSLFEYLSIPIDESYALPSTTSAIAKTVEKLLVKIDYWQRQHNIGSVRLFFNRHSKSQGYEPVEQTLLPIDLKHFRSPPKGIWQSSSLPTYQMEHGALLAKLVHQYLFVTLFRACAESQASEHASRLSAMKSAQRNLDDRLSEVTMNFRHARQTQITSELMDIVTGFEAIVGSH